MSYDGSCIQIQMNEVWDKISELKVSAIGNDNEQILFEIIETVMELWNVVDNAFIEIAKRLSD